MTYTSYYQSPIGLLEINAYDFEIFQITIVTEKKKEYQENNLTKECVVQLQEYFNGKRREFDIPVAFYGTDFQIAVWEEAMCIPYGSTASYKDIAIRVGRDKACRAVGSAMNRNPILIIMPCHRVINSGGGISGFRYGIGTRKKLMKLEENYRHK